MSVRAAGLSKAIQGLGLLLGLGLGADALACSCAPPGTPQQELAASSVVFRGVALQTSAPDGEEGFWRDVSFQVKRVWKGDPAPLFSIRTTSNSAACGRSFATGEDYLVYVDSGGLVLLCGRTALAGEAAADLTALGEGTPPASASLEVILRHDAVAGAWYNPARSGEGFLIDMLEDGRASVYWFGYQAEDPDRQSWLLGLGTFRGTTLHVDEVSQPVGGGFDSTFDADAVQYTPWGSLRLRFEHDGSARVDWESVLPGYGSGSMSLQRLLRPPRIRPSFSAEP